MTQVLAVIALLVIGGLFGWWHAHATIATECRRLGRFYVGDTVYVCVAEERRDDTANTQAKPTREAGSA